MPILGKWDVTGQAVSVYRGDVLARNTKQTRHGLEGLAMTFQAEVHWHEGMFLRPQHFQASSRYRLQQSVRNEQWSVHYGWGLRSLDLDEGALANQRLTVRSLKARLRDGTLVSAPEDTTLSDVDLKGAFTLGRAVTVYLAVPVMQLTRANIAQAEHPAVARYVVDTTEIEDENTGQNPQAVEIRRLNLKLLLDTQDHGGYEVLPIARITRADRPEAIPQLETSYIPPLMACDAWKPLSAGVLEQVYDRLGKKIELLSGQAVSRGITFDSQGQGDRLIFEQLRVMSEAYAVLGVKCFAQGVHPLTAYLELCRLVGQLSIFGAQRRPPDLPRYDHDDLGNCFWKAKQHIDALLDVVVEPQYKERSFIGAGLRMQVALEPTWLEPGCRIFVGVQSTLAPERCEQLLTSGLDMKIGSSENVDEIFRRGRAGLRFSSVSRPPRALPSLPGLVYFQVDRQSESEEWSTVQRSLAIAIRLNENLIVSDIQGQRTLTIKVDGQAATMQFTLYVVSQGGER